jgi:hypothetical protein
VSDFEVWLSIALGVFVAVLYPVLYRYIKGEFPTTAGVFSPWVKGILIKYGALFAFSLATAFIVLGIYRSNHPDAKLGFWTAVTMGFGFEAIVEKVAFPKSAIPKRKNSETDPKPTPKPVPKKADPKKSTK